VCSATAIAGNCDSVAVRCDLEGSEEGVAALAAGAADAKERSFVMHGVRISWYKWYKVVKEGNGAAVDVHSCVQVGNGKGGYASCAGNEESDNEKR
jgi:hypothetical protein